MLELFSKKKLYFLTLLVGGAVFLSGCSLRGTPPETYKVKLEVWGVIDDTDAYAELFDQYRKINPYVGEISYRKLAPETYKEDLVNALASGNGPDVFMIRNAWRGAFEDKIVPMPNSAAAEKFYRDSFVDVAATDFIKGGQIYGAPLSVDALGLYYNKDLFNAAGITAPPATWEDLLGDVSKLNSIDQLGNINQSAVALGTAYNINRSPDILTTLMLQMGSDIGKPATAGRVSFTDENSRKALEYYTQFASILSGTYSWNPRLHYSIDAFTEGTLAMMFNYSWRYSELQKKNAKLNFGVAPLPQFSGTSAPVNFANYWGFVVAKNKAPDGGKAAAGAAPVDPAKQNTLRVHEAWQLIRYMTFPHTGNAMTLENALTGTSKNFPLTFDPTKKYLEMTKKPAARRDLIDEEKSSVTLAPFAAGNLIAKNWYQGNPEGVETLFAEMIDAVNKGEKNAREALQVANSRVNTLGR